MAESSQLAIDRSERILILAPLGRDGRLAQQALESAGLLAETCQDMPTLCEAVGEGAGAVVLTQEALSPDANERLRATIADHPRWSDLPILVLLSGGAATPLRAQLAVLLDGGLNVTLLERPMRAANLASAVQAALRARRRQYELRDQLVALEKAEAEQRRAVAQSESSRQRLRVLVEVATAFSEAARDLPRLLDLVARRTSMVTGDGCALCMVDADRHTLELSAVHHPDPDQVAAVRQAMAEAPPRTVDDSLSKAIRATFRRTAAQSVLAVPMRSGGHGFGYVVLWRSASGRPYTPDDEALLDELADRVALAIDNARLFGELEEQAEIHAQLNAALREAAIQRDRALGDAQAERARLRELFMQVPAGIITTRGPDHIIDFSNPISMQIFGAGSGSREDVLGRNLHELLLQLTDDHLPELVEHAYHSGERQRAVEVKLTINRNDDGVLDEGIFNIILQPYRDAKGRIEGVILHATEVTPLVAARERIRHLQVLTVRLGESLDTEALFAHIVDAVAELLDVAVAGLFLLEAPEADFACVAARGLELGGAGIALPRYGSMAGRLVDERRPAVAVDDVSQVQNVMLPRLLGGGPVGAIAVAPIFALGEALGAIEVYSPNPRRWRPDDLELLAAFAAAAAVAISNARLLQREQQAIQARDDFLAAASHDLKNPLTAIRGAAQMVQRHLARTGSLPPERLEASIRTIDNAAIRMTSQIEELLDVARQRLGERLPLEPGQTDLVALARQLADAHQATSDSHPISLESELPQLVGTWDGRRVARAIDNLLSNAIKYSPEGGPIILHIAEENGKAVLSIRDHGVGIPEADLPHVFERFRRAANVLGRIEGTGIGLAAAAQIIQQHGGSIDLQSRENSGTTVTIRLPLEAPAHGEQGTSIDPPPDGAGGR